MAKSRGSDLSLDDDFVCDLGQRHQYLTSPTLIRELFRRNISHSEAFNEVKRLSLQGLLLGAMASNNTGKVGWNP